MKSLENKVCIVTGAAGVLCSAMVEALLEEGAKVALLGRTESKLEDLLKILPNPVRLQQDEATLVVIEYDLWKQKVLKIQQDEGAEDVPPRIT